MSPTGYDRRAGWRAAGGCMVALALAMGLGRFAFTPMLPLMLHEGRLELAAGGVLASLNYLGYFLGALSSPAIRARPARMVRFGLVGTALLLLGMGLFQGFTAWGLLRLAAGAVSAWTFVFVSTWGLRRLAAAGAPTLQGVIYAGPGLGIVVSGLVASFLGRWGSQAGWIGFGVLSLVALAVVWPIFREEGATASGAAAPGPRQPGAPAPASTSSRSDARWFIVLYGVAGFGYIISATFLPVIARRALPGSSWPDMFWTLVGVSVAVGALVGAWSPVRWDNRLLLAACYGLQALGVLLSVIWPTVAGFVLASLLLGLPFTALTMFAMREAHRLGGQAAAGLIGYATASYGVGQIIGPLFAAPLAEKTGSFALPLIVATASLALGGLLLVHVWWRSRASRRI